MCKIISYSLVNPLPHTDVMMPLSLLAGKTIASVHFSEVHKWFYGGLTLATINHVLGGRFLAGSNSLWLF